MECTKPNYMIWTGTNFLGKEKFIFVPNVSYNKIASREDIQYIIEIPCCHCLSCKIAYSRSWADRIALEAKKYKDNYFITLTYDDEHIHTPFTKLKWVKDIDDDGNIHHKIDRKNSYEYAYNSLYKRDMQLFVKRLRRMLERRGYDDKLIFFGCGEYGDESLRSHLHIILLNCPINDLSLDFIQMVDGKETIYRRSGRDGLMFSKMIYDCWHRQGEISVAPFSYDTASYVAQYCQKKYDPVSSKVREELGLAPEFVLMSNGIAKDFASICLYKNDNIVVAGHVSAIPRYFDKKIKEEIGDEEFYKLVGYSRIQKKLIRFKDYNNGKRDKDKQREVMNLQLIKKNKLRNKI